MHRFLISNPVVLNIPHKKLKEYVVHQKKCSLCHKLHNFNRAGVRFYSIKRSTAFKESRKKLPVVSKPFAEILIVTNDCTKQQKAPIKILSLSNLSFFTKTNLNLDELYKLKALRKIDYIKEHTYHNLNVIDNIPEVNNNIPSDLNLKITSKPISNTKIRPINKENNISEGLDNPNFNCFCPNLNVFQPEIIEDTHVDGDILHSTNNNKTASEEVIERTHLAFIEVCNYLKTPQRGLNALLFHRNRTNKAFPKIKSVNIYNGLLQGFSIKGDYVKISEILNYARQDNVQLDVHSFVAIFECLGRINVQDNHLKQIRVHAKEALKLGISFNDIMNEGIFLCDQRDMVLAAIRSHTPDYKVTFTLPSLQYNNPLVNYLNDSKQLEAPLSLRHEPHRMFINTNLAERIKRQIEFEKHGYITIKSVETKEGITEDTLKYRKAFDEMVKDWENAALLGFNRDLMTLSARRNFLSLEPFLRLLPAKDFVQIIIEEAKKMAEGSETYSPTCNQLYKDLGMKVYLRYQILRKQKTGTIEKMIKVHTEYCKHYSLFHKQLDVLPISNIKKNPRQIWQWIEHLNRERDGTTLLDHQPWIPSVLQNIGKFLYHIIMHDLKIDVNIMQPNSKHKNYLPSFYTIFRTQQLFIKEEVKPHPVLSRLHRVSVPETLTFFSNEVPMICPPVPWKSLSTGGYLIAPCEMIRLPLQAVLQKQRLKEAPPNQIYPSLDALNQLGAVPWKVNTHILDVILEVFRSGGSARLNVPEVPSSLIPPQSITPDMDKNQKNLLFRHKLQHRRKKAEMYSLWCDCLYRLSLANHFRDDVFWLPHNMDFRGRVYPIPPHLNHLGSDLARSMLLFAESRPLGPNGLDWLKLHLVNLTGLKKQCNNNDRLIFANEVMDKILDSADYPLTGKMWWTQSEEPWQTLACCMEIAAAHRSDNPEKFHSYFPVHQDGSCNGLQHYAALGRDQAGAYSVNLCPSSMPQDVYSAVVALVEQQRAKDEENRVEIAKVLNGFIARKVIKQTIMTTVYGVTKFGARLQIARQLKDIEKFPKEHVWAASTYLTKTTFESLCTMFTATREIQDWLTECARLISSICNENVEWVTPMGLPIVQPYNKFKKLSSKFVYEQFHMDKYEKPNVMKHKNAFPPNFIHSLDSSHMMLTSLGCEHAGIVFVSVHDCYWTHASTVPLMNKICRQQFVALHSQNILEDLSLFLSEKYSYAVKHFADDGSVADMSKLKLNRILRKVPKTGDFDINEILKSTYFFS
ncbi:hypothetical protein FQA39_LY01395 [Lamprigera yunnana]|nr:hypothetical protein FQA39_LY01395 [Lamprigera yunnana]